MSRESGTPVQKIRYAYATDGTVATAAWTQLDAALDSYSSHAEIYDSSGKIMRLGYGPAGSEVELMTIMPGGNGRIPLALNAGMRLCVRAVDAAATTGYLLINFYG